MNSLLLLAGYSRSSGSTMDTNLPCLCRYTRYGLGRMFIAAQLVCLTRRAPRSGRVENKRNVLLIDVAKV